MRIIKVTRIREYAQGHDQARPSLERWLELTKLAEWTSLAEVRCTFRHADQVTVRSGRTVVVFNIKGNDFRLVTAIHYNRAKVFVLRFLTHAEYTKDVWKDEL
jgi:mRNA interferase HigB